MSAPLSHVPGAKLFARHTFKVWTLADDAEKAKIEPIDRDSLEAIEQAISGEGYTNCTVFVYERDEVEGRHFQHAYRVRKGKPMWVGRGPDSRRVHPCRPDKLYSLRVADFLPVEPWEARPGADRLGVTPGLLTALERGDARRMFG